MFVGLTGCVDWVEDTQDLKKFVSKTSPKQEFLSTLFMQVK